MAELNTQEGEEEIVIVEELPKEEAVPVEPVEAGAEAEDDDDDDEGDARLAQSEDDSEDDIASQTNARRRKERRERQKRAREATERELAMLRDTVARLEGRVSQQEGHVLSTTEQDIVRQYHVKVQEAQQAERIMAAAINAGNGEDSVAASRIRDAAVAEAQRLRQGYNSLQQQKQAAATPQVDVAVQTHAQEWMAANPWYDPRGGDEDSAIVTAIDATLTREGYDPKTRGYWEELTRRAGARLNPAAPAEADSGRRRPPPQGLKREHVPASTKNEIYISPERKAAMMEAGYWDDPVKRARMAKVYAESDRQAASNKGAGS